VYAQYLEEHDLQDDHRSLLQFLKTIVDKTPSRVHAYIASIDHHRIIGGQPRYGELAIVKAFMKAVRHRPKPQRSHLSTPDDNFDPRHLLHSALNLHLNTLENLRICSIIILRTIPILRSGDIATIRRASIRITSDIQGRKILVFSYKGKTATMKGDSSEANYLEITENIHTRVQPANVILELKRRVDILAGDHHDRLITSCRDPYLPLSSERISNITKDFMKRVGIPSTFRPHAIRAMTSELLSSLGVQSTDIETRGGWASKATLSSRVRSEHYRSRIVAPNFVDILLGTQDASSGTTINIHSSVLKRALPSVPSHSQEF
jgi:hypothetical protein